MNLNCNPALADGYVSSSQKTRVITEGWWETVGYCLNCTSDSVLRTRASTVARDFICPICRFPYELKSSAIKHARVVQDGGYDAMMQRVRSGGGPSLLLLHYTAAWHVEALTAIHPVFLTTAAVRRRSRPHVRPKSRAEYWMCDLDLSSIPPDGKITVVSNGLVRPQAEVRADFKNSCRFAELPLEQRGWAALVLAAVRQLQSKDFTNQDVYAHEAEMQTVFPNNHHIRDKIRQQLQNLARAGYLKDCGRNHWELIL